jgi:hypothetical protein
MNNQVTAKADPTHYSVPGTQFSFEATVIDLRTGKRERVTIDGNTKAGAGKQLRLMGYKICDMGFI